MKDKKAIPPLLTVDGLLQWVEDNVPRPKLKRMGHETPLCAIRWFFSNQRVEDYSELSRRDMARELNHGIPPTSERWIRTELKERIDNADGTPLEAMAEEMELDLKEFFLDYMPRAHAHGGA